MHVPMMLFGTPAAQFAGFAAAIRALSAASFERLPVRVTGFAWVGSRILLFSRVAVPITGLLTSVDGPLTDLAHGDRNDVAHVHRHALNTARLAKAVARLKNVRLTS
jgi:hypothetical protein